MHNHIAASLLDWGLALAALVIYWDFFAVPTPTGIALVAAGLGTLGLLLED